MVMNINKIKASGSAQQPVEPGTYPGRTVQIIHYGLQAQRPYKGQDKPPAHEIGITYELVDCFMVDAEGNDITDKPRWVSEIFPLHNRKSDKARSTKRYEVLDPNEDFNGDFSKCIDIPINVTIVNNKVGDKIYTNIASITPMRAKDAAKCDALVNPSLVFDVDDPDMEAFASFPDWIKEKLKSNLEYNGSKLQAALGEKAVKEEQKEDEDAPWS